MNTYFSEEEIKNIQQFIRHHKYPTQNEMVSNLEEAMERHQGRTPFYHHFLNVYSEFGHYQYEASKVIYENIYNPQTVKKIGENINKKNGFAGLQAVFYMLCWFSPLGQSKDNELKQIIKLISPMWDGVGEWKH